MIIANNNTCVIVCRNEDLRSVVNALKRKISSDVFFIEVRRDFILDDGLREVRKKKFKVEKTIKVIFV